MYTSHFRKIAARLTIFCCPWYKTFPFWQKFDQRSSWKSCHLIFLSSASSKTQIYFQHVNVFKMLLTIIMTMVMMTIISAMIIITKYSLPTIDFATRYSTRYSDFLLQPYSNPTRSKKSLLVGACIGVVWQNDYSITVWEGGVLTSLPSIVWWTIFRIKITWHFVFNNLNVFFFAI